MMVLGTLTNRCLEFTSRMQAMSPSESETFVDPGPSIITVPPESLTISTSKPLPRVPTAGTVNAARAAARELVAQLQPIVERAAERRREAARERVLQE